LIAFTLAECCATTTKSACLIAAKPLSPVLRLAGDYRNTVAHAIDVAQLSWAADKVAFRDSSFDFWELTIAISARPSGPLRPNLHRNRRIRALSHQQISPNMVYL
jgi:hypothetical protein